MTKIYLHEINGSIWDYISKFKRKRIKKKKFKNLLSPEWCTYPEALNGMMGCWSLCYGKIKKTDEVCVNCEFYNKYKRHQF